MKRSESGVPKHQHNQCCHGLCGKHKSNWESVGDEQNVPNPGSFGRKTYIASRCCGTAMMRYKVVQKERCKDCGIVIDRITNPEIALCGHCGNVADRSDYYDLRGRG